MNIARARGLAEALVDFQPGRDRPEGIAEIAQEILDALAWTDDDEYAAVQRMVGAMVGKYGAALSEETEQQAEVLVFVALAGIGK